MTRPDPTPEQQAARDRENARTIEWIKAQRAAKEKTL